MGRRCGTGPNNPPACMGSAASGSKNCTCVLDPTTTGGYRHLYLSGRQHRLLIHLLLSMVKEGAAGDSARKLIVAIKSAEIVGAEEVHAVEKERHPLMVVDPLVSAPRSADTEKEEDSE